MTNWDPLRSRARAVLDLIETGIGRERVALLPACAKKTSGADITVSRPQCNTERKAHGYFAGRSPSADWWTKCGRHVWSLPRIRNELPRVQLSENGKNGSPMVPNQRSREGMGILPIWKQQCDLEQCEARGNFMMNTATEPFVFRNP